MDSENHPQGDGAVDKDQSPSSGYQPTTGRKLFMFLLCLCALIGVWVFYFFASK